MAWFNSFDSFRENLAAQIEAAATAAQENLSKLAQEAQENMEKLSEELSHINVQVSSDVFHCSAA